MRTHSGALRLRRGRAHLARGENSRPALRRELSDSGCDLCCETVLTQHEACATLPQHRGVSRRRIARIQWHVGRARLESAQNPCEQCRIPFGAHAHRLASPDALCDEKTGDRIRALVELRVSQAGIIVHHGQSVRSPLHLLAEVVRVPVLDSKGDATAFAESDDIALFFGAHERQRRQSLVGVAHDARQQPREMTLEACNGARVEQLRAVDDGEVELLAPVVAEERQRICH